MKTFCRIIACLMVALMLVSFVACTTPVNTKDNPSQQQSQGGDENSNSGNTDDVDPVKPVINERFDGEEIRFFVNGGEGSVNVRSIYITEDDDPDYEVNRKVIERNDKVEQELGVKIILAETKGMQEAVEFLQPILASKTYTYDVLALYQYFDLGLALGDTVGSFYNYLNMPEGSYLNQNAPYWNQMLFNTLEYKNVAFFITGDLNQSTAGTLFVSFVNQKMWDQYKDTIKNLQNNPEHYDSIYDIVNNGYWTLDLWMELSKMPYEDKNNNEVIDYEDKVGLMTYNSQLNNIMTDMLAAGSNVHYSSFSPDGTPVMTVNSKANAAFYEKLYTLLCESNAATIPWLSGESEDDETYIMDIFARGDVLMTVNTLHCAEEYLAEMTDDFYVMPLPMFDHNQFDASSPSKGYTSQLGDSVSQYAISKAIGDEKVPAVTATLELMGYYSMKLVTPAYFDKALKDRYTRNLQDKDMIDMIRAGVYSDFALVWSNRLKNVTWFLRQYYHEHNKIARNLKSWQDNCVVALKSLLPAIEEAFYVE